MSTDVPSAKYHLKRHDRNSRDVSGACLDVERPPIASVITNAPSLEGYGIRETRCACGQLLVKVREQDLELKCKRIVVIPFPSIEGWETGTS